MRVLRNTPPRCYWHNVFKKTDFLKPAWCHGARSCGIQWRFYADCVNIISDSSTNSLGDMQAKLQTRIVSAASWQCALSCLHVKLVTITMWSVGCTSGLIFLVNIYDGMHDLGGKKDRVRLQDHVISPTLNSRRSRQRNRNII